MSHRTTGATRNLLSFQYYIRFIISAEKTKTYNKERSVVTFFYNFVVFSIHFNQPMPILLFTLFSIFQKYLQDKQITLWWVLSKYSN